MQYSAYSAQFEGEIKDRGKFSAKLDPTKLQSLSESFQLAAERRKYIVAGFNSCGITREQYARVGLQFERLDSLERQISAFVAKGFLNSKDGEAFQRLVNSYLSAASELR